MKLRELTGEKTELIRVFGFVLHDKQGLGHLATIIGILRIIQSILGVLIIASFLLNSDEGLKETGLAVPRGISMFFTAFSLLSSAALLIFYIFKLVSLAQYFPWPTAECILAFAWAIIHLSFATMNAILCGLHDCTDANLGIFGIAAASAFAYILTFAYLLDFLGNRKRRAAHDTSKVTSSRRHSTVSSGSEKELMLPNSRSRSKSFGVSGRPRRGSAEHRTRSRSMERLRRKSVDERKKDSRRSSRDEKKKIHWPWKKKKEDKKKKEEAKKMKVPKIKIDTYE